MMVEGDLDKAVKNDVVKDYLIGITYEAGRFKESTEIIITEIGTNGEGGSRSPLFRARYVNTGAACVEAGVGGGAGWVCTRRSRV